MKQTIVLEGRNMIHDALMSQNVIQSLLISKAVLTEPRIRKIESLAEKKGIVIQKVRPEQIEHLTESGNAQGVIAYMDLQEPPSIEQIIKSKTDPFFLLISKLDYEQNLGAILRSAWAVGVDAVIVPNTGVHEITQVVAKISQGGAAFVPLIAQSLFLALTIIKKYAIPIIGVEVGLGTDYTKQNLKGPIAFVFGGEAASLSDPVKKYCDAFVNIPMVKDVASLNISVATALIIFEKTRQERT